MRLQAVELPREVLVPQRGHARVVRGVRLQGEDVDGLGLRVRGFGGVGGAAGAAGVVGFGLGGGWRGLGAGEGAGAAGVGGVAGD